MTVKLLAQLRGWAVASVLLGLVSLLSATAANPPAPKAEDDVPESPAEVREAEAQLRKSDYAAALKLLREAAAKDAELPPPEVMLARLLFNLRQPVQARTTLEQAASLYPESTDLYLTFATVALSERRFTDAQLLLEKSLAVLAAPSNAKISATRRRDVVASAHSGLASVAESRRDWKTAVAELRLFLEAKPRSKELPAALQRLGRAAFFLGDVAEAQRRYDEALKLRPEFEATEIQLAGLHTARARETEASAADPLRRSDDRQPSVPPADDYRQAEAWLRKLTASQPNFVRGQLALAGWLLDRDRLEEAAAPLNAAAKLEPDSEPVRRLRGQLAIKLGNPAEAEAIFEGLYAKTPSDLTTALSLVLALAEQTAPAKRQRGMELALSTARANPRDATVVGTLGWACYRAGRIEDAERFLREAYQLTGGRLPPEVAFYLAVLLSERNGKPDDVRALLKSALASGPFLLRRQAEERLRKLTP